MASAGNAFANFGAGFLGGYRDVLAMKMKEDSQSKRDEALANRQMNLEKLRQEFEGSQRSEDRGLRQQEIDQRKLQDERSYDLQRQQLAAQQANAAASRANASASLQEQIRHHKALEDASDPVKQYDKGLQIKEKELSSIKDPNEKALFENSGFITYKEYQIGKSKMDADVLKERADIAAKAIEGVEKAVEASGKDVIEYGAELGIKGKSASDIMAQLKYHAAASSISSYDAAMGRGSKAKEAPPPATSFSETQLKGISEALSSDPSKDTPEQAVARESIMTRLKSMPREEQLRVIKSVRTPSSGNPYPEGSDEYLIEEKRRYQREQSQLSKQREEEQLLKRYGL